MYMYMNMYMYIYMCMYMYMYMYMYMCMYMYMYMRADTDPSQLPKEQRFEVDFARSLQSCENRINPLTPYIKLLNPYRTAANPDKPR